MEETKNLKAAHAYAWNSKVFKKREKDRPGAVEIFCFSNLELTSIFAFLMHLPTDLTESAFANDPKT